MVPDPRTAPRADQLRPLNRPRPVEVLVERGRPAVLLDGADRYPVAHVQECWCIDDEWWRDPVQRRYYRIATTGGTVRTLYHDQITDAWFEQGY